MKLNFWSSNKIVNISWSSWDDRDGERGGWGDAGKWRNIEG